MENPATHANKTENSSTNSGETLKSSSAPDAPKQETENPVMEKDAESSHTEPSQISEKAKKYFNLIAWTSVALAFLPLILLVAMADGYDAIKNFGPLESLYLPIVMFIVAYIGSRYSLKVKNNVAKGLNAIFGTFYIFLLMLYLASGIFGLNAVLIIPLMLPVVLPVVFIWLLGIKVTLSKLRKHPVDENGKPIDPNTLDPMKTTLPDKTFAEIVFQIIGVFLAICLGYFATVGIISLL